MAGNSGFLYLNAANLWPLFVRHHLDIAPDGSLVISPGEPRGFALAGPFETELPQTEWFRLIAQAGPLTANTHVQFFSYTIDVGPPPFFPLAPDPFGDPGWSPAPRDLLDVLILNPPAPQLWLGAMLRGTGGESPAISQMRVEYGRDTYLKHLPGLYTADRSGRDFTERMLALYQTAVESAENEIEDLPLLFDPAAAPFPEWLDWLNSWLDFPRSGRWSEADARTYLSQAFELYGWRGTIEGLTRYLKIYAGVDAHITEPGRYASMWSLGEVSTLGFTTMLAPAPLQGAVLGSSAVVDHSRMVEADEGALLFEDVAHRFCVEVACGDLNYPGAIETVRAVLDREKPAHTVYELCTIDARMRVGHQARIGIDTIIAAGLPQMRLGMPLDGVTLAAESKPCQKENV